MEIINVKIGDIKPYIKNAKIHPEAQISAVAESIRQFGFRQPIVVDAGNVVVIGHARLAAAKKLGLTEIPVVRADDLTPAQINALRLADNKTNESPWDFAVLSAELDDLAADFDMADFGFGDPLPTASEDEALDLDDAPAPAQRGDTAAELVHCPKCGFVFEVKS